MEKEILDILKSMQNDIKSMKIELKDVNNRVQKIELQQGEDHQILKALEHSAEVNKAEHDKIINDVAYVKGDVEAIKKDLCRVEEATASNWVDIARLKAIK